MMDGWADTSGQAPQAPRAPVHTREEMDDDETQSTAWFVKAFWGFILGQSFLSGLGAEKRSGTWWDKLKN